jgi:hypothetical protein
LLPRGNSALPVSKPSSAVCTTPLWCSTQEGMGDVIPNILPNGRELSDTPTRVCVQRLTSKRVSSDRFSRTRFQCFLSNPPCSSFKKLIILTPRLVLGLCTMSLAKAVSEGIRDKECKRFALQEHPPVPYVPEKDSIQETVFALKSDQNLKTTIGEDAELRFPIWHCGKREAVLMHVSTALNAIKKRAPSRPTKKLKRLMWSNARWQSKQGRSG